MILDKIAMQRRIQLENEIESLDRESARSQALNCKRPLYSLKAALKQPTLSVIAEVKKASPSKGLIREDFRPVEFALEYQSAGANAISCLTEENYFQGSNDYLDEITKNVTIPVLRKDFVIDEYQIYHARTLGASAVLLICAILDKQTLVRFTDIAHSIGLEVLMEVHNETELETALLTNADVLGINNRDLKDFTVDLDTTARLSALVPDDRVLVSESGIRDNNDMKTARRNGADAVLIGETLMRADSITSALMTLREGV
ncbi:MAG: indole-3-glycerol phosphate synthase TrpC [Ruminococcus sp.]|nr:indole-3-glycerol phosphate synthase TrpC [Ruminococcus sp.]